MKIEWSDNWRDTTATYEGKSLRVWFLKSSTCWAWSIDGVKHPTKSENRDAAKRACSKAAGAK